MRTRLSPLRLLALWLALLGLLALTLTLLFAVCYRPGWDANLVTWLAIAAATAGGVVVALAPGVHCLGFVGVYGLYLSLSHLGAVGAELVSAEAFAGLRHSHLYWFHSPARPFAVALSGVGIGAFVLAATLASLFPARRQQRQIQLGQCGDRGIYYVGMALLAYAGLYMALTAMTGALPVFGSYEEYRSAMFVLNDGPMVLRYSFMIFVLATGVAFVLATGDRRQLLWGAVLFCVPALLLMISGNRGEVLYPAAAGVAVYTVRGHRFRVTGALLGLSVFFLMIPLVKQIRAVGVGNFDVSRASVHWTDPFVTNGYTLRPLVETVRWIQGGEELAYGRTYTIATLRVIGLYVPFVERPQLTGNRFYVKGRTPGQGYTVIAEAFFNFGVAGVIGVLGVIGIFFVFLDHRVNTMRSLAFGGAVMAVLVNNVRNAFSFVPGQIFLISVLFVLGTLLTKLLEAYASSRAGHDRYAPFSAPATPNKSSIVTQKMTPHGLVTLPLSARRSRN